MRGAHAAALLPQSTGETEAEAGTPDARVESADDDSGVQQPQREEAEVPDKRGVADASAERLRRQADSSADDVYGMSVATLSRAGTCQARRLNQGPWLNVRHKVEEAVTAGVRLWMELEASQSGTMRRPHVPCSLLPAPCPQLPACPVLFSTLTRGGDDAWNTPEEYPGAAAVRAKEVAQGTLAMSGECNPPPSPGKKQVHAVKLS